MKGSNNTQNIIGLILNNKFYLIVVFFLLWLCFFDRNNLISLYQMNKEISKNEDKVSYFDKEIEKLFVAHKQLSSNIDANVDYARKMLYVKGKNEDIYVVVEEQ